MNNSPINRFFFREGCENNYNSNYPGLIDAIYIAFFHNENKEGDKTDRLLELLSIGYFKVLAGGKCYFEDLKSQNENSNHYDAKLYDSEQVQFTVNGEVNYYTEIKGFNYNCSHLNYYPGKYSELLNKTKFKTLRVPIDVNKSSFSCKSQGQQKGITYLSELNVVFKERSSQVAELQHALTHSGLKLGVFFRDANGDCRLIADPIYDMSVEIGEESGQGPTGEASASLKFSQISRIPPIYYRGLLPYSGNYGMTVGGDTIDVNSLHIPYVYPADYEE